MEYNYITTCIADVSILLSVFDNCVPQRQLNGWSMTRPFSVKGVACETKFLIRSFDVGCWLLPLSETLYVGIHNICNMHPTFLFECLYDQHDSDQYLQKIVTQLSPPLSYLTSSV